MKARGEADTLNLISLAPFELLVLPHLIALVSTLPLLISVPRSRSIRRLPITA